MPVLPTHRDFLDILKDLIASRGSENPAGRLVARARTDMPLSTPPTSHHLHGSRKHSSAFDPCHGVRYRASSILAYINRAHDRIVGRYHPAAHYVAYPYGSFHRKMRPLRAINPRACDGDRARTIREPHTSSVNK